MTNYEEFYLKPATFPGNGSQSRIEWCHIVAVVTLGLEFRVLQKKSWFVFVFTRTTSSSFDSRVKECQRCIGVIPLSCKIPALISVDLFLSGYRSPRSALTEIVHVQRIRLWVWPGNEQFHLQQNKTLYTSAPGHGPVRFYMSFILQAW